MVRAFCDGRFLQLYSDNEQEHQREDQVLPTRQQSKPKTLTFLFSSGEQFPRQRDSMNLTYPNPPVHPVRTNTTPLYDVSNGAGAQVTLPCIAWLFSGRDASRKLLNDVGRELL